MTGFVTGPSNFIQGNFYITFQWVCLSATKSWESTSDDWEPLIFNSSSGSEDICTLTCHSGIWTFCTMKNLDGHHKGMSGKGIKAGEMERQSSYSYAIS